LGGALSALAFGLFFIFVVSQNDVGETKEMPLLSGHLPAESAPELFLEVRNRRKGPA